MKKHKQTATEWLEINLMELDVEFQMCLITRDQYFKKRKIVVENANKMEKEQKIEFADEYADAVMSGCIERAEQYYNEKYEK